MCYIGAFVPFPFIVEPESRWSHDAPMEDNWHSAAAARTELSSVLLLMDDGW